jgi:poly-gamma-glutamate capsule biosynthesis protein CapA/YwtB (metallophosphatase superfamily)
MTYEAEQGNITIALVGDAMITRPVAPFREPNFLAMVEVIRSADARIANLEQLFHNYEMSWSGKHAYSFQAANPANLDDLTWMGFQAVSTATNHAYDYNEDGFLTTLRHCDERGLLHAGGGVNLGEARAPALLDTAAGRVALMSACTTFDFDARAGDGRPDFPGKPGINGLRHKTVYTVPRDSFEAAKRIKQGLWLDEAEEAHRSFQPHVERDTGSGDEVDLFGRTLRLGDEFGVETTCNEEDLAGVGNWIRGAGKQADWLVYGLHGHESAPTGPYHGGSRIAPAAFHVEFAHFTIDQGCDVVAGHGSHFLRGIEIYNGRPIFYSLGNFIFQNETVPRIPTPGYAMQGLGNEHTPGDWGLARSGGGEFGFAADPVFYRSVVAVCEFAAWELKEIRLHPIELGFGKPMSQRGRPMLVRGDVAREILEWQRDVSAPFGTEIAIEGDIGVIRP